MPSLYVHVPFCLKKCAYCAFYSIPLAGCREDWKGIYLQAVAEEAKLRSKEAQGGVSSLFLGGGTPTILEPLELDSLLSAIHKNFSFGSPQNTASPPEGSKAQQKEIEKTVEANPGTLTKEKLNVLVSYGINRISLGAQSFNDRMLVQIGRIHNKEDIRRSVWLIRQGGIHNLNLDLIFGLPGQTLTDWQDTLRRAVELEPEHLSLYALMLEEGTPLARKFSSNPLNVVEEGDPVLPDDDIQADMYEWAAGFLQQQGYRHYEISNFARAGFECRHNLTYWQSEEYLGLGPGAVSCLGGVRTKNTENLELYGKLLFAGREAFDPLETEVLTREQKISEYLMLALRTAKGVDLNAFTQKFKESIQDIYGLKLIKYIDKGVLIQDEGRLRVNPRYFFVLNSLLVDIICQ
ncbi:MAG TPA: radical SAM family heme chaperone HemW [Peptococcaceae bacterium]|nr:radical SAM family heme chaperone HemW [Peptococcaceae bacterium]